MLGLHEGFYLSLQYCKHPDSMGQSGFISTQKFEYAV